MNFEYCAKLGKKILCIILSIFGFYIALKIAIFYTPFLIAFIIALIIEPAIRWLMRKFNLSRKLSAIIIFIIVFTIIMGSLIWGITVLISESTNMLMGLNDYVDRAYDQIHKIINDFDASKFNLSNEITKILQNSSGDMLYKVSKWLSDVLNNLINFITSIPVMMIYLVVTILALYFICTERIYILDQIEHQMPKKWVIKIGVHFKEITKTLGRYLKAQFTLIFVSFVISLLRFIYL